MGLGQGGECRHETFLGPIGNEFGLGKEKRYGSQFP